MRCEKKLLHELLVGMHDAYENGENAMEFARKLIPRDVIKSAGNDIQATLISYDLQAGSYVDAAKNNRVNNSEWCAQISDLLSGVVQERGTVLEVGCGEATTLTGVMKNLGDSLLKAYGFDLSWSRVDMGNQWLKENAESASLFVGDLFDIPLCDSSVDVVYSSHSLEPNGGREEEAIKECLRVARRAVVLIEPIYELANKNAQIRMEKHGYIRNLFNVATRLGVDVLDYRLLDYSPNPNNPSGVLVLIKNNNSRSSDDGDIWMCPLTTSRLTNYNDYYYAADVGVAYPVLRGVPMLRSEHAIIASGLSKHI